MMEGRWLWRTRVRFSVCLGSTTYSVMTVFNLWRGGINKQYNIQIRNGYTDFTISMVITRLKNPTRLTNLRTIRQTIYIDCISNYYGYKEPFADETSNSPPHACMVLDSRIAEGTGCLTPSLKDLGLRVRAQRGLHFTSQLAQFRGNTILLFYKFLTRRHLFLYRACD